METMEETAVPVEEALPNDKVRWVDIRPLEEKRDRGVKQVRITSLLDGLGRLEDVLVGTAEAAAILRIERPRIAKWIRAGIIPEPIIRLESGPIWLRSQIESALPEADARRRK